ncbi:MAG: TlpA disulfide reductase family protein [Agriterribacter sp.]
MRLNAGLLLPIVITIISCSHNTTSSNNDRTSLLNIGDPAPPLKVSNWLKGKPVQQYEKGKVYIIEFWATWCAPCKAAMPHLSDLSREYGEKVTIIGMDIMEKPTTPLQKIKDFVDSMGVNMDYTVAVQDSNFMEKEWLFASGEQAIPQTFVVNQEGKLAWIGHPGKMSEVLNKVINKTWDIKEALNKRTSEKYLMKLDDSLNKVLMIYAENRTKPGDTGMPDMALLKIEEIVDKEPALKYAPLVAFHTFEALLKTNPHKAYEYGKTAIATSTYQQTPCAFIIGCIDWHADKLNLPAEIYRLGAEAYQAEINDMLYPELVNIPRRYAKMAGWYWRANEKEKAIAAQTKAIEELKKRKGISKEDLSFYEEQLMSYKNP